MVVMAAFKDESRNTWFCQFYYEDWQGEKKQKKKRGFKTKKEALEWENTFKMSVNSDMNMTLETFVETYFRDKEWELKERSKVNKRYMINVHIIPYLGSRKMSEITPTDIIQWQNTIRAKGYSQTYLRMIQNQLTALFTHASNIYNLSNNPCKKVKKMGKSDADKMNFWTKEEYDKFLATFLVEDRYRLIFAILFWTGMRVGEILAICKNDIDIVNSQINISKTFYRLKGEEILTKPKTEQSVRSITIPNFLMDEIKEYLGRLYEYPDDKRIFSISAEAVQHKFKRHIEKAGIKQIRVHDLRHSHVAFLIHQGVQPLVIKERLGHKDIKMTMNTYGHLYPNQQKDLADMLDNLQ